MTTPLLFRSALRALRKAVTLDVVSGNPYRGDGMRFSSPTAGAAPLTAAERESRSRESHERWAAVDPEQVGTPNGRGPRAAVVGEIEPDATMPPEQLVRSNSVFEHLTKKTRTTFRNIAAANIYADLALKGRAGQMPTEEEMVEGAVSAHPDFLSMTAADRKSIKNEMRTLHAQLKRSNIGAWDTHLQPLVEEGTKAGADWYDDKGSVIDDVFGADARAFRIMLAVTSAGTTLSSNTTKALNMYLQWRVAGRRVPPGGFEGDTPAVREGLANALTHGVLGGSKIGNFVLALEGDRNAIVVDMWMARAFGLRKQNTKTGRWEPTDEPTDRAFRVIDRVLRVKAAELGMDPRALQAAIWRAAILRDNPKRTGIDSYDRLLQERVVSYPGRKNDPFIERLRPSGKPSRARRSMIEEGLVPRTASVTWNGVLTRPWARHLLRVLTHDLRRTTMAVRKASRLDDLLRVYAALVAIATPDEGAWATRMAGAVGVEAASRVSYEEAKAEALALWPFIVAAGEGPEGVQKYSDAQPREPAGTSIGGRWASGHAGTGDASGAGRAGARDGTASRPWRRSPPGADAHEGDEDATVARLAEWEALPVPERVKAFYALSDDQRDAITKPMVSIEARMAAILGDRPWPARRDVLDDVGERVASYVEDGTILPDAGHVIERHAKDLTDALRGAGAPPVALRTLVRAYTDVMVAQEYESMGRSLGDHGVRHLMQDVEYTHDILAQIPGDQENDTTRAVTILAGAMHDIGYLSSTSRIFLDKDHPRHGAQVFRERYKALVTTALGEQAATLLEDVILHHADTDVDWAERPVQSAFSLADNLAIFHQEKLPAILRYSTRNRRAVERVGAKQLSIEEAKQEMRATIGAMTGVPAKAQRRMRKAVDELNPILPKLTLGMQGGRLEGFDWRRGALEVRLAKQSSRSFLSRFSDLGLRPFTKLMEAYGVTDDVNTLLSRGEWSVGRHLRFRVSVTKSLSFAQAHDLLS